MSTSVQSRLNAWLLHPWAKPACWVLCAIPWFVLEKHRPGQPLPPGTNYFTAALKQAFLAAKHLRRLRQTLIYLIFYFLFGIGLFASTTLIPQILQSLYGYRAIDAGLVLGPGAFVITLLAPVGAQLVQRKVVHPRVMLLGAVTVVGLSFVHYSRLTLQSDYAHYALARAFQGLGYAFFEALKLCEDAFVHLLSGLAWEVVMRIS